MSYEKALANITTFIFDVDGVLTDGGVILDSSGEMVRTINGVTYQLESGCW